MGRRVGSAAFPRAIKIAGNNTDVQWNKLKARLLSKPTWQLWDSAYRRFYRERINTRYLRPIDSIQRRDTELGEGFAIAALFCSLIEFLESCEQGKNYRYIRKGDPVKRADEYDQFETQQMFRDFLDQRPPFNTLVPKALLRSFYSNVRCGLLHEARTNGGWVISTHTSHGALVSQNGARVTLYRNELIPALERYFTDYRQRLRTVPAIQTAFITKFDALAIP